MFDSSETQLGLTRSNPSQQGQVGSSQVQFEPTCFKDRSGVPDSEKPCDHETIPKQPC
jgi:hypothetical protein